jgi:xanthine phosphoribosyltransferase
MTKGRSSLDAATTLAEQAKTRIEGTEFVDDIVSLVTRLKQAIDVRGGSWSAVVGVVRGGVFPARRVAEALGLDYREIRISYYQGTQRRGEPRVIEGFADQRRGEGLLVVDDVVDSGGTALCVRRMWPRCDLAAVYTKPGGLAAATSAWGTAPFHGRHMDDRWIVFPWDQPGWEEQSPKLVAMFHEKIAALPTDPDQGVILSSA